MAQSQLPLQLQDAVGTWITPRPRHDGRVLVVGGSIGSDRPRASADIWEPGDGWTPAATWALTVIASIR